jgi:chromosome segregation ATPase
MYRNANQLISSVVTLGCLGFAASVFGQPASVPIPTPKAAATTPEIPQRITSADLEDTLVLIGELDERMRLAELKLDRDSLDRKHEIGRLRGLLSAVDQQIRVLSASIQRKEEKLKQFRQEVFDVGADESKVAEADAAYEKLARRLTKPLEAERERLERLGRQRVAGQQKIARLQEELVEKLMQVNESQEEDRRPTRSVIDDVLDRELGAATNSPKKK